MSRARQAGTVVAGTSALLATIAITAQLSGGTASTSRLVVRSGNPGSGAAIRTGPADPAAAGTGATSGVAGATSVSKPQAAFSGWAEAAAATTGIPARALMAYAAAQAQLSREQPSCHLTWPTLAGIGYVESRNGELGGGLLASGRPFQDIVGVALNGTGAVGSVPDSDGGALDGDATVDRAVGPLQFLPSTWAHWEADGDGDGVMDPQDIDDAALAAARYLCEAGDLATTEGWTGAVLSYNHSPDYVASVFAAAQAYAQRSTR